MSASTKRKVRPAYGWAGVMDLVELDLRADQNGYGLIYQTRKAARERYTRVVRVKVVQANSKTPSANAS